MKSAGGMVLYRASKQPECQALGKHLQIHQSINFDTLFGVLTPSECELQICKKKHKHNIKKTKHILVKVKCPENKMAVIKNTCLENFNVKILKELIT